MLRLSDGLVPNPFVSAFPSIIDAAVGGMVPLLVLSKFEIGLPRSGTGMSNFVNAQFAITGNSTKKKKKGGNQTMIDNHQVLGATMVEVEAAYRRLSHFDGIS